MEDGLCYQCTNTDCAMCPLSNPNFCTQCTDPTKKPSVDGTMCNTCTVSGCNNCDVTGKCVQCADITMKPNAAGDACVLC